MVTLHIDESSVINWNTNSCYLLTVINKLVEGNTFYFIFFKGLCKIGN